MSMTLALSSALNNLRANQTLSSVISRNIESASIPSYVRKDSAQATRISGGVSLGVQVVIARNVDERLVRDVRGESSASAALGAKADALKVYADVIGQPQDESSVASRVGDLKTALGTLVDRPGDEVVQRNVVRTAGLLADRVKDMYAESRSTQTDADNRIKSGVDLVNANLKRIEGINKQIATGKASGRDVTDLQDQRDLLADQIAEKIGITTYQRESGEMIILAKGGATLLDTSANLLTATPFGTLRTADGTDLTPGNGNPTGMTSGELAGLYEIRDRIMPGFQDQLDQFAGGLMRMFQSADPTVGAPPNDTGLFTDNGAAFDPANVQGMAERIRVNPIVLPESGGNLWRISSGMHAAAPAPGGDNTQANRYLNAFNVALPFTATGGLPASSTIANYATSMITIQQNVRTETEAQNESRQTTLETLKSTRSNRDGVNIDDELQKMLVVQQSYAASANVITTVKELMDRLIAI